MYKFSRRSKSALITAHPDLQLIFNEVIKHFDCTVIWGHRNRQQQEEMFNKGYTILRYPKSKHNSLPSLAVDVVPYPIDWKDLKRFYFLAGLVKAIAAERNIKMRWGGDWDNDNDFNDQTWFDLPHYELL